MKKILSTLFILFVLFVCGQTTWDFNDTSKFAGTNFISDQLIQGINLRLGTSTSINGFNNQAGNFSDGYTATQRLQMGGVSYNTGNDPTNGADAMPTRRYLEISITEPIKITVWSRGGGVGRKIIITDGITVLGSYTFLNTETNILTTNYSGSSSKIYIANAIDQNSLFKVRIEPLSNLSVSTSKKTDTKIYTSGKTLTIKDLKSKNTEIKVYNMNGTLVKSVKTSTDMQFELNSGLYIIHTKSELGEKSVKVSIK